MIRHGEELCIRGEGMPIIGGGRGDLRVRFEVEMPGASWAARLDGEVSSELSYPPCLMDRSAETQTDGPGTDGHAASWTAGDEPSPRNHRHPLSLPHLPIEHMVGTSHHRIPMCDTTLSHHPADQHFTTLPYASTSAPEAGALLPLAQAIFL